MEHDEKQEEEVRQQRAWLCKMALFCHELQEFIAAVPADAKLQDYALDAWKNSSLDGGGYSNLVEACNPEKTSYMSGISCSSHRHILQTVHNMGVHTCNMINRHPVFGVFQANPETRVELFFERPLNMCMALGVEHSLQNNNLCTSER